MCTSFPFRREFVYELHNRNFQSSVFGPLVLFYHTRRQLMLHNESAGGHSILLVYAILLAIKAESS